MLRGDAAYPTQSWLLEGYSDAGNLTEQQDTLMSGTAKPEGVWNVHEGMMEVPGETAGIYIVLKISSACCILHNAYEKHGEAYEEPGRAVL